MNTTQVKLFFYGIQMLLDKEIKQTDVVFKCNNGYISATFYKEDDIFQSDQDKFDFRQKLIDEFQLRRYVFNEQRDKFRNNIPLAIQQMENFIKNIELETRGDDSILFDVKLLNLPTPYFPFLLIDNSWKFKPVSFISSDIEA